ncbi:MAG: hypothetical protein ABSA93_39415 [Streptosporangiaceae bacterium]
MAVRTPGLAALLLLVAGAAGFVIPVTSLLVPLITRQHHWSAATAGLIVGAQAAGAIVIALAVARRGTSARPGLAATADVLGAVAHAASPASAMVTCASVVTACALSASAVPSIRQARPPRGVPVT